MVLPMEELQFIVLIIMRQFTEMAMMSFMMIVQILS